MTQTHCKFSNCIKRHGMADIELILSCCVLITILLLCVGAMRIGVSRLQTSRTASFQAFNDATSAANPQYATGNTVAPLNGLGGLLPDFPNRVHDPHPTAVVSGKAGNPGENFTANVGAQAITISPTWSFSCYPVGQADQGPFQQWMQDYVNESHTGMTYPLGLSASWPP